MPGIPAHARWRTCFYAACQEPPTIETADADFNVLGIPMRGYRDFGCALQAPKGGIKNKGEA